MGGLAKRKVSNKISSKSMAGSMARKVREETERLNYDPYHLYRNNKNLMALIAKRDNLVKIKLKKIENKISTEKINLEIKQVLELMKEKGYKIR